MKKVTPDISLEKLEMAIERSITKGSTFGGRKHKTLDGRMKAALAWSSDNPQKFKAAAEECLKRFGDSEPVKSYTRSIPKPIDLLTTELAALVYLDPGLIEEFLDGLIVSLAQEAPPSDMVEKIKIANLLSKRVSQEELAGIMARLRLNTLTYAFDGLQERLHKRLVTLDAPDQITHKPQIRLLRTLFAEKSELIKALGLDQSSLLVLLDSLDKGFVEAIPHLRTLGGHLIAVDVRTLGGLDWDDFLIELEDRGYLAPHVLEGLAAIRQDAELSAELKRLQGLASINWPGFLNSVQRLASEVNRAKPREWIENNKFKTAKQGYTTCPICGDKTKAGDRCRAGCFEAD
jgi:hypothetical protein